jgi:hypothetical protein
MDKTIPAIIAFLALQSGVMSFVQPAWARAFSWVSGFACGILVFMIIDAFAKTL